MKKITTLSLILAIFTMTTFLVAFSPLALEAGPAPIASDPTPENPIEEPEVPVQLPEHPEESGGGLSFGLIVVIVGVVVALIFGVIGFFAGRRSAPQEE